MQTPSVVALPRAAAPVAAAAPLHGAPHETPVLASAPAAAAEATAPTSSEHSVFAPLLLGLLALCAVLGQQCFYAWQDHQQLRAAQAAQQPAVDNAVRMRAALDALAADTQRLADAGNASAAALVAQLNQGGITINPDAAGSQTQPTR